MGRDLQSCVKPPFRIATQCTYAKQAINLAGERPRSIPLFREELADCRRATRTRIRASLTKLVALREPQGDMREAEQLQASFGAQGKARAFAAAPRLAVAPGAAVQLHGLTSKPELNGTHGIVLSGPARATCRYAVRCACDGQSRALKEE